MKKKDFPGKKSTEQLLAAHLKMNHHSNTYSEVFLIFVSKKDKLQLSLACVFLCQEYPQQCFSLKMKNYIPL